MSRCTGLAAAFLALLMFHLMDVPRIAAESPTDDPTEVPQYEYYIVSGLRDVPGLPLGDLRISDGWHDYDQALDFGMPAGVVDRAVYADIRYVSGDELTARLRRPVGTYCTGLFVDLVVGATTGNGASNEGQVVATVTYLHMQPVVAAGRQWPLRLNRAAEEIGKTLYSEPHADCKFRGPHLHQGVFLGKDSPVRIWHDTTIEDRNTPPYTAALAREYDPDEWVLWRCIAPSRPLWKLSTGTLDSAGSPPSTFVVTRNCHILTIAVQGDGRVTTDPPANPANGGAYHDGNATIRTKSPLGTAQSYPSVTLSATPKTGQQFVRWEGTGIIGTTATQNPASVTMTQDWTLTAVFEPLPAVTVKAVTAKVTAGTDAKFTLTRTGSTAAALPVTVEVTGAAVSGTAPTSVTIPKDAEEATLTVATLANSAEGAQVTAKVGTGTGYVTKYAHLTKDSIPSGLLLPREDRSATRSWR